MLVPKYVFHKHRLTFNFSGNFQETLFSNVHNALFKSDCEIRIIASFCSLHSWVSAYMLKKILRGRGVKNLRFLKSVWWAKLSRKIEFDT